jgi:hypothetical protein
MANDITEEPVITEHTWTNKVGQECIELATKINSLTTFISSEDYSLIDQVGQLLLQAQLSTMIAYLQLLTLRLSTNVQGDSNET